MTGDERPWPPLIHARNIPAAVRWRDALLTLLAWVVFAVFLDLEFRLSLASLRALEAGRLQVAAEVLPDLQRLTPFLAFGAVLAVVLFVRSVRTQLKRSWALSLPPPDPLPLAEEAGYAGIEAAALIAGRDPRIVVVHDDDGGLRIEAKD